MTTTISEQDVQARRAELQSERVELERRRPGLAVRKEGGDSAAAAELVQVSARLAELQQELAHQDLVATGIAEQRARARQQEIGRSTAAEAERRQKAEADYRAALIECDRVCHEQLDSAVNQVLDVLERGIEAGRAVDAARAATDRPGGAYPVWVTVVRQIAERTRGLLSAELARMAPQVGLVFVQGGPPSTAAIPFLSRDNPVVTLELPPDRIPRRDFPITGPNVRPVTDAVLPAPLPTGQAS